MSSFWDLVKKGNISSGMAALGNIGITALKGVAAAFSGSGAMFASAMHSAADAVNQAFVFSGSVLAEKAPTKRFPSGFGRVINIFCMVAVIVITIMAYETILEGFHLLKHPAKATHFLLNFIVLAISVAVDGIILIKAMKEIAKETRTEATGLSIIRNAAKNVRRASPPTRLVFYEDIVATLGALLALVAVVFSQLFAITMLDGIASILIGILMVIVAFRVGYDNMIGLIGVAAPADVEQRIASIILSDQDVNDINKMRILQEGRFYHVESYIELRKGLTLAEADDIKFRVRDAILADPDITDVTLGIIEENNVQDWTSPGN